MTLPRLAALPALLLAGAASAQAEGTASEPSDATVGGSILEPEPVEVPDDAGLAGLVAVPEGFAVTVAARGLGASAGWPPAGATPTPRAARRPT